MLTINGVVGITPSMLDQHYFFRSRDSWLAFRNQAGMGDDDYCEVENLSATLQEQLTNDTEQLVSRAGSSVLAVMAVLPEELKTNSELYASSATNNTGIEEEASANFHGQANLHNIRTVRVPVQGRNPTIHILVEPEEGLRCFVKEVGVSKELDFNVKQLALTVTDRLLVVDGYELNGGQTAATVERAIRSSAGRVAMSLGSDVIIRRGVGNKICDLDARGYITALFGNTNEYRALLNEKYASSNQILQKALRALNANIIMTDGPGGIYAVYEKKEYYCHAEAVPTAEIVSSSGTGDAVMGIVIGATALGEPIGRALHLAAEHSAAVIRSSEDIVPRQW